MELSKILRNPNTYIYLGSAVVAIGLMLVLTHKKKTDVAAPGVPAAPGQPTVIVGGVPTLISNFDATYDYKLENGKWYTKKKTSAVWLNMKDSLSAVAYAAAVVKLTAFLNK